MRAPQGYEGLDLSDGFDYGTINVNDLIVTCDHYDPTDIQAFEVHHTYSRAGAWSFTGRDHEGVRCAVEFNENDIMAHYDLLAAYTPIPNNEVQP